jgi:hypothetical protein
MIGLRTSANHGSKSPRTSGRDYCRIIGLCECPGHPVKTPDSEPSIHGLTIVLAVFICRVVGCEEGTVVGCQKGIVAALAGPVAVLPSLLLYFCSPPPHTHPSWASSARVWCGLVSEWFASHGVHRVFFIDRCFQKRKSAKGGNAVHDYTHGRGGVCCSSASATQTAKRYPLTND